MADHRDLLCALHSCNVGCPCILGEMEGDRGWCSGALIFDVQGGTDVGGTKVAFVGDWPSGAISTGAHKDR